jgi:hypothetical protein
LEGSVERSVREGCIRGEDMTGVCERECVRGEYERGEYERGEYERRG